MVAVMNPVGIEAAAKAAGQTISVRFTPGRSDDVVNNFSSRGPTRGAMLMTNGQRVVDNLLKPDLVAPGNRIVSAAAQDNVFKIGVNRRINQTLEAMAQAIFKSWFVDFDPVKAKIAAKSEGRDQLRAAMAAISSRPIP